MDDRPATVNNCATVVEQRFNSCCAAEAQHAFLSALKGRAPSAEDWWTRLVELRERLVSIGADVSVHVLTIP